MRWIAARSPRTLLIAGWAVFFLGSYPGYMSVDSTLQLYTVRSGDYTDYAPVMTALWGALEYVIAGPFPMLALQSGLFLFGLYAILSKLVSPRAAAVTAPLVLLFPPVFAPMAVIWPDSLMAGALLAATGAALGSRGWRIAAVACLVVACSCRPEAVVAAVPIVLFALAQPAWPVGETTRWRRVAIGLTIVIGVSVVARGADWALTVTETHDWRIRLMVMDTVGTLRRAKVTDEQALSTALAGLPLADSIGVVRDRLAAQKDALDSFSLVNGKDDLFDPITTDDHAHALARSWIRAIEQHPGAYAFHRWTVTRRMLGISGRLAPVYDKFGNVELLAPLHHRASVSDWQFGMQHLVRATAKTPLFKPWLFIVLGIAALIVLRRQAMLRALLASGLAYEIAMVVFAPSPDYRFSHWLVTVTTIGLAALIVTRVTRRPERADG